MERDGEAIPTATAHFLSTGMLRPRSGLDFEAKKPDLGLGLGLDGLGLGLVAIGLGLVAFWPRGLAQNSKLD